MSTTDSLRIDHNLVVQAEREGKLQHRSKTKQLEYWAKIGKISSKFLKYEDLFAVSQGLKSIVLQDAPSIDPLDVTTDDIISDLENDRKNGSLSKKVTSAPVFYEPSTDHPGYLDQVNTLTKERIAGSFENGEFKAL